MSLQLHALQGQTRVHGKRVDSTNVCPRVNSARQNAPCGGSSSRHQACTGPVAHARRAARLPGSQSRRNACAIRCVLAEAPAAATEGAPRGTHWKVHKFGGTCMASAERIRGVAELMINSDPGSKVVVVSAMGSAPSSPTKVTDLILNMIARAAKQDAAFLVDLAMLQEKHVEIAKLLLGDGPQLTKFVARLMDDIGNLKAMLQAISIGEACSAQARGNS